MSAPVRARSVRRIDRRFCQTKIAESKSRERDSECDSVTERDELACELDS